MRSQLLVLLLTLTFYFKCPDNFLEFEQEKSGIHGNIFIFYGTFVGVFNLERLI